MRLEKVEVFGFKSFPQKVTLQFDRGVTALVGPNGCGKTNIVEAIRWALGEQNAHLLRCDKMEDLIFTGTDSRKPLGIAEVTLILLNDGDLPLDFSEVAISRRIYRSGESEYLINKRQCRLRDIMDLFMDTGLGAGAYSFFEQKQIDQILSSDPASRRSFFEEASEIAKYRRRKRESLKRLDGAQSDLLRLGDIIAEVEHNLKSLRRQAKRAERYLKLKDELRERELALAKAEVDGFRTKAEQLRERLSLGQTEADRKRKSLLSLEESLEQKRSSLSKEEAAGSEARAELERLTSEVRDHSGELLVQKERMGFLEERGKKLRDELATLQRRLPEVERLVGETMEELKASRRMAEEKREKLAAGAEQLRRAEAGVSELRLSLAETEDILKGQLKKRENLEREFISVKVRLEAEEARGLGLRKELDDLRSRRTETDKPVVRSRLAELRGEQEEEGANARALDAELQRRRENLAALSGELAVLERDLQRTRSELDVLSSYETKVEGYASAVKYLLRKEGVKLVCDLIQYPASHQKAVEGVLSHKSQAVVVPSDEDALRLISLVRERGRVVLLPANLIQPCPPSSAPVDHGVIGVLNDIVSCEEGFGPILEATIGRYVIVEDLETALRLSKMAEFRDWGIVTLGGEVVEPSRAVTAGPSREDVLGRKERLRDLEEEAIRLEGEVGRKRREVEAEAEAVSKLSSKLEENREKLSDLEQVIAKLELELSRTEYEGARLASAISSVEKEQLLLGETLGLGREKVGLKEAEVREFEEERVKREEEAQALATELRNREAELDELSRTIDRAQIDLLREEDRVAGLSREFERRERERAEVKSLLDGTGEEIEETEGEICALGKELKEGGALLRELTGLRESLLREREEFEQHRQEAAKGVDEEEKEATKLRQELAELEDPVQNLRMDLLELELQERGLRERIAREYGMDIESLSPQENPPEDAEQIEELKRSIARLEPINPTSLEEFKEAEKRLDFLKDQRSDLVEAEGTLKRTLSAIDRKARAQFASTFADIRANFKSIFRRLFGEGEADLLLPTEGDPLEGEIGIVARPPGKRLQRIELLSAGERSLLAIALLFAIYLTRPSPFCILDELDASLDDANLGRYISIVQELSQDTQLALVTHNRRTMEIADYLYGVTMEEPGVTSIVSVKMERGEEAS